MMTDDVPGNIHFTVAGARQHCTHIEINGVLVDARRLVALATPEGELPEVVAWRKAREEAIAAVEVYNAAVREARAVDELRGLGFRRVDKEYHAMTEASNKAYRLVGPMLDAMAVQQSITTEKSR